MIVCSCNLFTDKDIKAAMAEPCPPRCVRDVYKSMGCAAKCGGCALTINRLLQAEAAKPRAPQREPELQEMAAA
jgi:bacterioferritin-associated ferredoxin